MTSQLTLSRKSRSPGESRRTVRTVRQLRCQLMMIIPNSVPFLQHCGWYSERDVLDSPTFYRWHATSTRKIASTSPASVLPLSSERLPNQFTIIHLRTSYCGIPPTPYEFGRVFSLTKQECLLNLSCRVCNGWGIRSKCTCVILV